MRGFLLGATLLCAAFTHDANADPAAWRVSGRDGGEIWLLGSMHYLRAEDYPLPALIEELYERADAIVMELDLDDLGAAQQQSSLVSAAVLPRGTTLRDVLDADVYQLTERHARAAGIDLALLQNFEPWLVAITLLSQGMTRLGYEADRGLEQYLVGKARRAGKEILGLESLETQIRVFDQLPRSQQQALLEQTLQELETTGAGMMEQLADAWRAGQLETLADQLLGDFEGFPGLYETLVTDRNTRWLEPLEGFLDERRPYLVVVGALHLVGRGSVVELLQMRGHTVTRIE
ncbi:MAG TPA: TraB/GumN family protein [Gammaproteobacteria bacterium]|nr:TraB/GumN family protein [Gammaproteobacteria bacterium]